MRLVGKVRAASASATHELVRLLRAREGHPSPRSLSDARIRRVHATQISALNSAVKRKGIPYNPAAHVELASDRSPRAVVWTADRVAAWQRTGVRPKVAVWTAQQAGAFLDVAMGDRLHPIYHLIAYRGLRRGEAVGLRWEDIDLDVGLLRITQQIVQLGWRTELGEPKTDSSVRMVTLDAASVAMLGTWRATQAREHEEWGRHGRRPAWCSPARTARSYTRTR
jgi:integrase